MFCKNCGHENADDVHFCINCGNELNPQPVNPVETSAEPVNTYAEPTLPKASQIMGLIAMICGIVSVVLCFCYGSGIVLAIAALVLGILAKKKAAEVGMTNGKAKLGTIFGIIGTVLNGLYLVYEIVVYAIAIFSSL